MIESKDNFNYSRGLLFALAIPYYHMGARVGYAVSDKVSVTGYLVNGWNNVKDNNDAKTVGASLAIKPTARRRSSAITWWATSSPRQRRRHAQSGRPGRDATRRPRS